MGRLDLAGVRWVQGQSGEHRVLLGQEKTRRHQYLGTCHRNKNSGHHWGRKRTISCSTRENDWLTPPRRPSMTRRRRRSRKEFRCWDLSRRGTSYLGCTSYLGWPVHWRNYSALHIRVTEETLAGVTLCTCNSITRHSFSMLLVVIVLRAVSAYLFTNIANSVTIM